MKNPNSLAVPLRTQPSGDATTALVYPAGRDDVGATLILGHGAGAGQGSAFMVDFARALSALGIDVVTFDFPYMHHRRRIPDRGLVLESSFRSVIEVVYRDAAKSGRALFIGGKSMGGRIATQVAAADDGGRGPEAINVRGSAAPAQQDRGAGAPGVTNDIRLSGLVLLGYPLHPPGRPDERRDKHLGSVRRPILFIQGSRDPFGTPAELGPILSALEPAPVLHVVPGGDHSFKLNRKDAAAQSAAYAAAQQKIVEWIRSIVAAR